MPNLDIAKVQKTVLRLATIIFEDTDTHAEETIVIALLSEMFEHMHYQAGLVPGTVARESKRDYAM